MFEEIRMRVKEGRWIPVNGWWVQPDCNMPSGESFARHALYSQLYYREKFGENPSDEQATEIAEIIAWNIWQMDGRWTALSLLFQTVVTQKQRLNCY